MDAAFPPPLAIVPDLREPEWRELLPDAVAIMSASYEVTSLCEGVEQLDDCFHVADHDAISEVLGHCRTAPGQAISVPARFLDGATGWRDGIVTAVDFTQNSVINAIVVRWRPNRATDHLGDSSSRGELFRHLVESSSEGVLVVDRESRISYGNDAAAEHFGRLVEDLEGLRLNQLLPAEAIAQLTAPSCCATPITVLAEHAPEQLMELTASSSSLDDPTGNRLALLIRVNAAVTAPREPGPATVRAEETVATEQSALSDELRRALTDAVPVGLFELDAELTMTSSNAAWRRIVTKPGSDASTAWLGRIHPDDLDHVHLALEQPRTGTWFCERYRVERGFDEWGWVETGVVAVVDGAHHAGTTTDVSAAVEFEVQIAEARDAAIETSRLKSEFLANMSHEIRTPLNGVIGMATLLLDTPLNRDQRERVVTLRSAGEHLLSLVNDILDFSKVETGKLELERIEFDLLPVISQVVSLYSSAGFDKGVRLRVDTDASLPRSVIGDPARLRQILSNLVGNAIKFTDTGAVTIRVTAEGRRSTVVRLEVEDSGIGIGPEAQAKIFEPFMQADSSTTRKFGGTGLGLPICRKLVDLMGGVLSVDSKPGHGSTFWFTIPFGDPSVHSVQRLESEPHQDPESMSLAFEVTELRGKVLLVEDNPINQKVALGFLSHLGWDADVAGDGLEGVEAASQLRYSVILMDCQMPRMDGYEATGRIRAMERTGGRTPIIALTAGAMPGDRERCLEAGMDDYLSKPIDIGRLDALLRNWARPVEELAAEPSGDASAEFTAFFDADVIGQLKAIPSDHGTLFEEALVQFVADAASRFDSVRVAAASQDWRMLSSTAHALKGMAASIGANRLAELADALQQAGHLDDPDSRLVDQMVVKCATALELAVRAADFHLA